MLTIVLWIVLIMLSISIFMLLVRTIIGPTMPDRAVALDTVAINIIGGVSVVMMLQETMAYTDVALVIGILAFIGSIAFAKFIERGTVLERDNRNHR